MQAEILPHKRPHLSNYLKRRKLPVPLKLLDSADFIHKNPRHNVMSRQYSLSTKILLLGSIVSMGGHAIAGDTQFHPICLAGKTAGHSDLAGCREPTQFVRHREDCTPGSNKCFVVGNDGWDVDLIGTGHCASNKTEVCTHAPFRYAILEYRSDRGDQAVAWQSAQRDAILNEIRETKPTNIVVFIHGWNHDAKEDNDGELPAPEDDPSQDSNLRNFKFMLAKTHWELKQQGTTSPRLLGVYVGWNGNEGLFPINIGSRARAADRVASAPDFDADLGAIAFTMLKENPNASIVIIGHSLGGRIVARYLLSQAKFNQYALGKIGHPLFGNRSLFVTVNPAIGADAFDEYYEKALPSDTGLPLWLNFTSKDDSATGIIFSTAASIGKSLGFGYGITDNFLTSSSRRTIGHFRPYVTHRLEIKYFDAQCSKPVQSPVPRGYPPVADPRTSMWYSIDAGAMQNWRALYFGDAEDCSGAYYATQLSLTSEEGARFRRATADMWNVIGDKDIIDCGENAGRKGSTCLHNAFLQTSLNRMVLEFQRARITR